MRGRIASVIARLGTATVNLILIALGCAWTAALGLPLVGVTQVRDAAARLGERLGWTGLRDRAQEANAALVGRVAQGWWAPVLLGLFGVRLRVRAFAPPDWEAAHVVCANHASIFDALSVMRVVPPPYRFVAKREMLKWPVIGWLLRPSGQIVVDRDDHEQAVESLSAASRKAIRGQVIFFVEGTRSRTGRLQAFKKGAFHFAADRGVPILPVAIAGSYGVLAKRPWWHVRRGRTIEVMICRPIVLDGVAGDAAVEGLAVETRDAIAGALATGTG